MSNVYLLPSTGDVDEIAQVLLRAGITPIAPETVRELIIGTHNENVSVVFVRPSELIVLQRYANTLVDVIPTVVMAAPGLLYTHEWSGIAATFPAMDWLEFKDKFRKSGATAFTPGVMSKRHEGKVDDTFGAPTDVIDDDATGEVS